MKIVHIITRLIVGGAQENTVHTVEDHIREFQDDVILITGPALGPEGSLMERAQASGCHLIEIDALRRSIHPLREWSAYRELVQQLKQIKPDLVHTHSSKAGILGRRAAHACRLPCVHTIHGAAFHYGQHPLLHHSYRLAERIAARWTDHYISVADAMSQQYLDAGISTPDKYTTISSGFDVSPFLNPPVSVQEARERWGIQDSDIVIGKIGRLFPLKGHESLLEVADRLVSECPQIKFLLVGDGILRQEFEERIAREGLTDHFVFTGLVPPTEIPRIMPAMDIVVHTSQWEGLARVLPQGLISGKPVVSFDIDGAREVVIPDQTGFLIPRNDLDALSEAILKLAQNPDLRMRLGQTGRERFSEQFRHNVMSRKIRDVYHQVLAQTANQT